MDDIRDWERAHAHAQGDALWVEHLRDTDDLIRRIDEALTEEQTRRTLPPDPA